MIKEFNVKGPCIPHKHYMVDISSRLEKMKQLVEREEYFVINRARQYGKTTTLVQLKNLLSNEYVIISLNLKVLEVRVLRLNKNFVKNF